MAHTHALRKSFASIKGFYLQAELHGVPILWLVPGSARQEIPPDVDLKVLLTFLEFYEVLLQFVNYKLYAMRRLRCAHRRAASPRRVPRGRGIAPARAPLSRAPPYAAAIPAPLRPRAATRR